VLDNGRLTDSKGKTVNFRNAIIIMTSNVGSEYFRQMTSLGFEVGDEEKNREDNYRAKVMNALKETFKPEFLNRLDEIIIFRPLSLNDIRKIVDIQLNEVKKQLENRGIKLNIEPAVKSYLAKNGFDPEYGARPLKRLIQKVIVDALADKIIRGIVKDGKKVNIVFKEPDRIEVVV
jgi:ATP-dependent Clp protease ATP-binding subunit ClpA